MYKNIIPFIILSIFFITPCYADTVINGDFDTNLSGWSHGTYVQWEAPGRAFSYADSDNIWQDIDLSGDVLSFSYDNNGIITTFLVTFDGNNVYNEYSSGGNREINTSGYSGVYTVFFNGNGNFHLDNVHTDYIIPSTISFYPTLINTTPTHINFSITANDEDTEYGVFIYRNVSNTSNYIDYVGWFYDEVGSAPIEIIEYGDNCTYYAKLWGVSVGDIATCEQEYIFNGSIDPFPTPQPTPNFTPVPTYTPPPTPIPPDQPNVDNGSLNMTWLNGYYNLVDSITSNLFHPIYNMTAYIMMPVNILSGSISGLMNQMELTFNTVTNEILTATSILNILFTAMPSKILNVMTYYLLWIIILLVVKGDT